MSKRGLYSKSFEGASQLQTVRFGLAGDMHYGSAFCNTKAITDYYKKAEAFGADEIFQVGDLLEGDYRHHTPRDLAGHGFDEQAAIAQRLLPVSLPTTFIVGNHDETFGHTGQHPGTAFVDRLRAGGRHRIQCIGDRRGFVKHHGVKICLFHPSFGCAKANAMGVSPTRLAPTSKLEQFLCAVKDSHDPDIVAVGHWHQSAYFLYRGMHVLLTGAFQNPQGSFSNSLASDPAVGSWLVEVELTKRGRKKTVTPKWLDYGRG